MSKNYYQIIDNDKNHGNQYKKQLYWNTQRNSWYAVSTEKPAEFQPPSPMILQSQSSNFPQYVSLEDSSATTYQTQHDPIRWDWQSTDKLQKYRKDPDTGNWIAKDLDPSHNGGNYQYWDTKKEKWIAQDSNGRDFTATYQMKPPVALRPKTPQAPPTVTPNITSGALPPQMSGTKVTYSGSTKPKITKGKDVTIKEVPAQYDLLFNSLAYMSTIESVIEEISLDLIASGDDLLTNFNYKSIDYLPDFDVQTTDKYNDYVDAIDVLKQTEIYDTEANNTIGASLADPILLDNIIDQLIEELKNNLQGRTFAQTVKYFGTLTASNGFNSGFSKAGKVDFRYPLNKKYDKYNIKIDFNPI